MFVRIQCASHARTCRTAYVCEHVNVDVCVCVWPVFTWGYVLRMLEWGRIASKGPFKQNGNVQKQLTAGWTADNHDEEEDAAQNHDEEEEAAQHHTEEEKPSTAP